MNVNVWVAGSLFFMQNPQNNELKSADLMSTDVCYQVLLRFYVIKEMPKNQFISIPQKSHSGQSIVPQFIHAGIYLTVRTYTRGMQRFEV